MTTPSENATSVFGRHRRALTLGILLSIGAFALEGMGVVPALPTAVRALGGMPLFGWAFSAFMLAWIVGTVASGLIADARGPALPMALGLSGFGAGLILAGTAQGMFQFLAGRALQGLGGGAMIAASYVAIARGYADEVRPRMMALTASVWIVPALIGPALSGAVTQRASWRWIFVGIVPLIAAIAALILPPLLPFSVRRPAGSATRILSALWLALGTALMLSVPSLRSFGKVAMLGAAVLGFALLAPALHRLMPPGTTKVARGLPSGLLARGLLAFSFFGTEAFIPLGAIELRAATPTEAGLALSAGALGWIAASWLQERVESRHGADGRARRVEAGFWVLAIGITGVAVALLGPVHVLWVPVAWAVSGAGVGLAYSADGLICIALAAEGQEGEVSGQLQMAEALCTAAGAGLGGILLTLVRQAGRSPREAQASVFALTLLGALLGVAVARRLNPSSKESPS